MNLAEKAFKDLFPNKKEDKNFKIKYSKRLSKYNANVKYDSKEIVFSLSKEWEKINKEIVIGLLQKLFLRIYNSKKITVNIELYNNFIKNMSKFALKQGKIDPILKKSFERVNNKYFYGLMDMPNLRWGDHSFNTLGSYEYVTDTIIISQIFKKQIKFLDYIMYHELLHKKLKFYDKNGRSYHHTKDFKLKEKEFEDPEIEKKLKSFLKKTKFKYKMKKGFGF